jgi:hypothetical protein
MEPRVLHIPKFGDASKSPAGDTTFSARDVIEKDE